MVFTLFAESSHASIPNHPEAATSQSITVSEISQQLDKSPVLRGQFVQEKQFTIMTRPLVSKGNFVLARTLGIWMHNDTPIPSDLVLTDAGILQINASGERETIDASQQPAVKLMTKMIRQLVAGDWEQLSLHFDISASQIKSEWRAHLAPKPNSLFAAHAQSIEVHGTEFVSTIVIIENSGDETRIHFDQITSDRELSAEENDTFHW
ncbi:Hypothetical protein HDN1F_24790 [gamma proteobacterium HdN1]|nr:Hypothetical protein HDN1F_24790 [gamma proteobacterium HdN1]